MLNELKKHLKCRDFNAGHRFVIVSDIMESLWSQLDAVDGQLRQLTAGLTIVHSLGGKTLSMIGGLHCPWLGAHIVHNLGGKTLSVIGGSGGLHCL